MLEEIAIETLKIFLAAHGSKEVCAKFLRYVTGSRLMPSEGITVMFHGRRGTYELTTMAHTCVNAIEISRFMVDQDEFNNAFLRLLDNKYTYTFTSN